MRILVAGALGEVGRTVSSALEDLGHSVVRVSGRGSASADVLDLAAAATLVRDGGVAGVLNCSGRGDRRVVERSGLDATSVLAPVLREVGVPGVLISTLRVMEGYSADFAEDAPPQPRTPYAQANADNEAAWLELADASGHVLRIANYFAAPAATGSPQAGLLPWSLVTEALASGQIGVRSGPSLAKEFVSASDVARAVLMVLSTPAAPAVCATAPGASFTLAALVEAVQAALAQAGLSTPPASFGSDGPAVAACRSGWLAAEGWRGDLDAVSVRDAVADWIEREARV